MKKPYVIWAYFIIGLVVILNRISSLILNNSSSMEMTITIISIIPLGIFLYLFFMLKRSSLIWLYITFGLTIIGSLILGNWISAGISLIFAWIVWDYIRNKKINNQYLFN